MNRWFTKNYILEKNVKLTKNSSMVEKNVKLTKNSSRIDLWI